MIKQFCKTTWPVTVLAVSFLLTVVSAAAAQSTADQPPLLLSKTAEVEPAVAGDTLTYLLTLTNTGQIPLEEVVVSDVTPAGTTLFGVGGPPAWKMTSPGSGQSGEVTWQAMSPLSPGETVILKLIITINLEATGPIINETYTARAQGWTEVITGPPIVTELILPTPTRIPPLLPTKTPTKTPTEAPTKIPAAETPGTTPTAATSSPPDVVEQVQPSTPLPAPTINMLAEETAASGGIKMVGLIIFGLTIIIVSAVFIIKRRT